MAKKLSEIASILGLELRGQDCDIIGVNTLELAGPHEISFLANPRYADKVASCTASAIIISADHAEAVPSHAAALVSENPYFDFGRTLALFAKVQGSFSGISDRAFVHPDAVLGENCTVYPHVYIGPRAKIGANVQLFPSTYIGEDCKVGARSVLYPNVTLMAGVEVGEDCILHAGVVLGADGFGFVPTPMGIQKIPQIGTVHVGNDVEIGANATIDRAVMGVTRVGDGTKIDNLVMLGHNVEVGKNSIIVAQVGVSGSTKIGDQVTIAGQAGIAGHLNIGNKVTIGPLSGVAQSIPDGKTMGGTPAVDQRTYMRTLAVMPKLPDLFKRCSKLEKELAALKASIETAE